MKKKMEMEMEKRKWKKENGKKNEKKTIHHPIL
jgi:hypothetical protein